MCLIAVAWRASRRYPLIVAANRDEAHSRPTAPAEWWAAPPGVLGGRDLEAGGTWLAVDKQGRFAAVTNLRPETSSAADPRPPRSRGFLVADFLTAKQPAREYAADAAASGREYAPFNLLVADRDELWFSGNRAAPRLLGPGVHAVSNVDPGVDWPKVTTARQRLTALLDVADPAPALLALLAERQGPVDGFDDRQISPFQLNPVWGTRSSTVVLVDSDGHARFLERSFDAAGRRTGDVEIEFALD